MSSPAGRRARTRTRAAAALSALLAGGCAPQATPLPPPPTLEAPDPDPTRVTALLVLVGDAGTALPGRSPLLARVADDLARWAARLDDGRTLLVHLGDLVYPWGVRPPDHPEHATDTLHLHAQLEPILAAGGAAAGIRGWFLDGNHDWGHLPGGAGLERLRSTAAVVDRWSAAGLPVRFMPEPGSPGPVIVDVGERHRIVVVGSTAWFDADDEALRVAAGAALASAVEETGRTVTVLAHHPLQSAGEHGDDPPVATGFGLQYLASRAGLVRQDMSSAPYRRFIDEVRGAFARRAPLVWASGHDHTLQLLRAAGPGRPTYTVVSGSGSKLGGLGRTAELLAGGAWPGYVRLFLLADGGVQLQMVAAPAGAQHCTDAGPEEPGACMRSGVAAYRTVLSRTLRPAGA